MRGPPSEERRGRDDMGIPGGVQRPSKAQLTIQDACEEVQCQSGLTARGVRGTGRERKQKCELWPM